MKNLFYPIVRFVFTLLLITNLSRVLLFFYYIDRTVAVPDFYKIFTLGFRLDFIFIGYVTILPTVLLFLLPDNWVQKIKNWIRWYFVVILIAFSFMELLTIPFINQYDVRPNRLFIDYLMYPKEVTAMLGKGFLLPVVLVSVFTIIFGYIFIKETKNWIRPVDLPYWKKLACFVPTALLLFVGIRNTFDPRPANPSNAVFSSDQMVNNLPLNSAYTVFYAAYSMKDEEDAAAVYGKMDFNKALALSKEDSQIADSMFVNNSEIPSLHKQNSLIPQKRPYNLVILLQESLGADYIGCLGGLPLSPNVDALSKEGQLFTNLYSSGTRSVQGIEAVTSGFYPNPSKSVVKLSKSQNGFFTLGDLLSQHGYQTSFIYGGSANFDNMASYFSGNGFQNIIDEKDYQKFAFKGTWGVSDEDLMRKAHETYLSYGDKPFFSVVFSSSNHEPFEFPDGRIKLYENPKATVNNAIKYADYAIGEFFKMAKNAPYYKNTIFIVIADHNTRTYGNMLVPIHKFHIPALIIGPGVPKEAYTKLCAQIDIPPTLLDYVGINNENPMLGRNLRQLDPKIPGRAIMQFNTLHAYLREDNTVTIYQPKSTAKTYVYDKANKKLTPTTLDKKLAETGLAQMIFASEVYKNYQYKIPNGKK